ncbi:MAG: hypothetical protein K2J70_04610 [Muribaculaceae bacterium]|nr:hypothetical protein [Muribaculaceae bacterium]
MRKSHLLSFILIMVFTTFPTLSVLANQTNIRIKYQPKKTETQTSHRAPLNLPIEVLYDSDTLTVTIISALETEAEVYIYNASGELEDSSPCLNTVLTIGESEYHTILIESQDWSARGIF